MRLLQHSRQTGPKEAGPCTEDSIRRAMRAAQEELRRDGLEHYVNEHGRLTVRVAVQTYRTEKVQ